MDVLADILNTVELTTSLYFRAVLRAPFAVAVPADGRRIRFHIAGAGGSWIGLPGGESTYYSEGDLILVPHGSAHVLADGPDTVPRPLAEVIEGTGFAGEGALEYGGAGPEVVLVCGHFAFDEALLHPILASLPPLVRIRADETKRYDWIESILRHVEHEARTRPSGYVEVVRRLSEILLIEVLRARTEIGGASALAALADPQIGRVLGAIHAEPHTEWSLDRLARIAGQSRTLFAERFRARLGMPPMKYLAYWRMQKARTLLSRTGSSVADVARRVGYSSESAFTRTFREQFGAPPGSYRNAQ